MATIVAARRSPVITERMFFTGIALAMLMFTFVGFAPTYYLATIYNGVTTRGTLAAEALTPAVHAHGLTATLWMLLLVLQTGLVAGGRRNMHRGLGIMALPVGGALAVTAMWVALAAARAGATPPPWTPEQFLLIQIGTLGGFLIFGVLGLVWRKHADFHKRLMILATISMMVPAGGRIGRMLDLPFLPGGTATGMILADIFLIALVAYDLQSRGRIHSATMWGGGALLLAQPLRLALARTDAWESVGRAIIG